MTDLRSLGLTISGLVAHFVLSLVLGVALISAAYEFSRHGGSQIGSVDELYRLGQGPRLGFGFLALSGFADLVVSMVLLGVESTRRRAWIVPLAGIVVSILVVIIAIATFHPAEPFPGG